MTPRNQNLENRYRWVASSAVILFGLLLGIGLVLHILSPGSPAANAVLNAGLILLMAAPGVRLSLALAERIRRRDWTFVWMTAAVVVELAIVMWRATQKM